MQTIKMSVLEKKTDCTDVQIRNDESIIQIHRYQDKSVKLAKDVGYISIYMLTSVTNFQWEQLLV